MVIEKKPCIQGLGRKSAITLQEGEGRQSPEILNVFPPTSRRYHACFTPSPRPERAEKGGFVRDDLGSRSNRHKEGSDDG